MSTAQKAIWVVIVVVILGGLYWWWSSSQGSTMAPTTTTEQTGSPMIPAGATTSPQAGSGATSITAGVNVSAGASAPMTASVTFDGSSFSPASVTIAQGGTVTWTSTDGDAWIASDPHPIHNGYDGTTLQQHCAPGYAGAAPFDECAGGTTWSFTFDKVGTWGYHDHLDASVKGTVTVVAAQ